MSRPSSIWREPGFVPLGLLAVCGFAGFMLLLPVAPLWAVHGGADEAGAGLVNGVTLLSTVAFQPLVPWSLRRLGYATTIVGGLVFLGLPSLGYLLSDGLAPILVFSALRGVGFAVQTVVGGLLAAELAPPGRRGAAIGAYGLAVAIPNVVLVPLGVPLVEHVGFEACFWLGASPILGAVAAPALQRAVALQEDQVAQARRDTHAPAHDDQTTGQAVRRVLPSMALLLAVTMAGGCLITFLPQMITSGAATAGLAALGVTAAGCRWLVGTLADRRGPEPYLAPFTLATAASMGVIGWALHADASPWVIVLLTLFVGATYGALQNLTMVVAFTAVARRHYGTASAWWNVGFDAGTAMGSIVVGLIASLTSFAVATAAVGVVSLVVLPLAVRRSRMPVGS